MTVKRLVNINFIITIYYTGLLNRLDDGQNEYAAKERHQEFVAY
jgi:hypothetical protein